VELQETVEFLLIICSSSSISKISNHSGAIKALQFNPHRDDLLASSGSKGELYITNIANPSETSSFRLGTSAARADDFDAIDWNKKVAHILVTGSSGGFATVWDVRTKKESINLNNYGRKPVSSIAWDPTTPTKVATATSSDQEPVVLLWDLRNSNAPERILRQHDQGILSLSWSRDDPRLLLSCGKDNRTICWDAQTGEPFGELDLPDFLEPKASRFNSHCFI
jgi:protein transport protein SEC31